MDHWDGMGNSEADSHNYSQLIFDTRAKQFYTETVYKANSTEASGLATDKTMNLDAGLTPFVHIDSEWAENFKMKHHKTSWR